ncbi:hypothetical protein [Pseudarthrobacter sp. 1C304]|uniref:hypothetical protein n=1 Tax=Pseudarthrobacter sp. 1C304 TaxID=3457438 RepID=UPI003FD4EE5E
MIDFIFESVGLSMKNNMNAEALRRRQGDMPIFRAVERAWWHYVRPRPRTLGMCRGPVWGGGKRRTPGQT